MIPRGRRSLAGLIAGVLLLLTSCSAEPSHSSDVRTYVDEAVKAMSFGIFAEGSYWERAVRDALPDLYAQPKVVDTYPGLDALARKAGGGHSSFLSPAENQASVSPYSATTDFPVPTVRVEDGVGVLTLPMFNSVDQDAVDRYQDAGIQAIAAAREDVTCGWIVDLRMNHGGSAYPMLSAVAPLLDDGRVWGIQDRTGDTVWVSVDNGNLIAPEGAQTPGIADFTLDQPVAIATGEGTASAAEVVVVAFAGQESTARFGAATAGLTTSNEVKEFSDGAALVITTGYDRDRDGNTYDGPIPPDFASEAWKTPRFMNEPRDWLTSECR